MLTEDKSRTVLAGREALFGAGSDAAMPPFLPLEDFSLPYILEGFKYPVSSWPILLTTEQAMKLAAISTSLPRLLHKIPQLYFNNNIEEIANFYFNGNLDKAQFALLCHEKEIEVSSRCDLVLSPEGFKVLEVNMGSSIGGMEVQNFAEYLSQMHPLLQPDGAAREYWCRPTQSIYIDFILKQISSVHANDLPEINIYLVSETLPDELKQASVFYNTLLNKALLGTGKRGNVLLGSIADLKFTGEVLVADKQAVHAVLIFDFSLINVTPDLFRAFITDKVYFPDNLATMFLKDKRNLALLQCLALDGKLEAAECEQVLTSIPWSVIIEEKQVAYQGNRYHLPELLMRHKDEFVIKIADGLQGKDVHIGRFVDQPSWQSLVARALKSKMYIAQQYCQSQALLAPNRHNVWVPHNMVWGAFGFGNSYGGVWARMAELSTDSGVINSATGAIEGVVYECS